MSAEFPEQPTGPQDDDAPALPVAPEDEPTGSVGPEDSDDGTKGDDGE